MMPQTLNGSMKLRNWTTKLFSSSIGTSAPRLNGPIGDIVPLRYMTGAPSTTPSALMTIECVTTPRTCLYAAVPPKIALKIKK